MFALTLPMTRLAVGDSQPTRSCRRLFLTAGRAAVAGLLSAAYLLLSRVRRAGHPESQGAQRWR